MSEIITRFPPSPTGYFHIGSARTALFNFLYAKQKGGKMVLRLEDTDKERSKGEYEKDILDNLKWLGINFDNEPVRQSERTEIYKKYLNKMIEDGNAYISKEASRKDESREVEVIRFKNPNKKITFEDAVRGEISFDTTELGDFVIAKNMDEPLYHLAVVIDDYEMGITHVIRGEDHISNTPRQILIGEAIGAPRPVYAHIPLILAPDRSKLSKRHGAVSLTEYKKMGYLPEAIVNYLALLGWNPGDDREIFLLQELIEEFDLNKIQKGGAIFNQEKLDWINKEHLKKKKLKEIYQEIENRLKIRNEYASKLAPTVFERINKYGDIDNLKEAGEFDYFEKVPDLEEAKILWSKGSNDPEETKKHLTAIIKMLLPIDDKDWAIENIKEKIWQYAEEVGKGEVLWPMRYSLSGKEKSPDPFTLTYVLGKEETLKRLKRAEEILTQ